MLPRARSSSAAHGGDDGGADGGEDHSGADTHTAASEGSHTRAGGYFLKDLWSVESPWRSRFIMKDCSPW